LGFEDLAEFRIFSTFASTNLQIYKSSNLQIFKSSNLQMTYSFCGHSGLQLPAISLGFWHNFGDIDSTETATSIVTHAFDSGVTHFDLANNYGPPPGSAERNFGKILRSQLAAHRDEIIISTKAGHEMWSGPYGNGGSRKSLVASLNQSLQRLGVDYVDIFYSHRYDPQTPVEETVQTLIDIVKQGKALYAGISKYPDGEAEKAYRLMSEQHVPCLVFQDRYSLLVRTAETTSIPCAARHGVGFVAFSPLAQGLLTNRYLSGIPQDSRAAKQHGFLSPNDITHDVQQRVLQLYTIAQQRKQTLAEMSLAWILRDQRVNSVIVGASRLAQLQQSLKAVDSPAFSDEELSQIEKILT
jgi:L-glyceraldehyde 3-phosphate reductase